MQPASAAPSTGWPTKMPPHGLVRNVPQGPQDARDALIPTDSDAVPLLAAMCTSGTLSCDSQRQRTSEPERVSTKRILCISIKLILGDVDSRATIRSIRSSSSSPRLTKGVATSASKRFALAQQTWRIHRAAPPRVNSAPLMKPVRIRQREDGSRRCSAQPCAKHNMLQFRCSADRHPEPSGPGAFWRSLRRPPTVPDAGRQQ